VSGKPAAEVQTINLLAQSLMEAAPDKYKEGNGLAQARLDAVALKVQAGQNPVLWYANALEKYMSGPGALATKEELTTNIKLLSTMKTMLEQSNVYASPQTPKPQPGAAIPEASNTGPLVAEPQAGELSNTGLQRQLEIFKRYPQSIDNYVMGKYPNDPARQAAVKLEIQNLIQHLPTRP